MRKKCRHFESCSAPLCPLCKEGLQFGIWYPQEVICRRREFQGLQWIKQQKKLKKKADPNYYFTYEILNRQFIVRKGIKGLSPDKPIEPQLKNWLKKHREIKESQLKAVKANLAKASAKLKFQPLLS